MRKEVDIIPKCAKLYTKETHNAKTDSLRTDWLWRIVQITHARAYRGLTDTVQVTALADVVPENLQKIGDLFDVPTENRYADYQEMLAHAALDVVTIATPHSLHAEQVIEAANAGVAVISEKPMATTLEEADTIMEAVRRNGVPYTVVHNYIFTAGMRAAMTELDALGESHFGRSTGMGLKPADFSADLIQPRRSRGAPAKRKAVAVSLTRVIMKLFCLYADAIPGALC